MEVIAALSIDLYHLFILVWLNSRLAYKEARVIAYNLRLAKLWKINSSISLSNLSNHSETGSNSCFANRNVPQQLQQPLLRGITIMRMLPEQTKAIFPVSRRAGRLQWTEGRRAEERLTYFTTSWANVRLFSVVYLCHIDCNRRESREDASVFISLSSSLLLIFCL